MPTSRRADAAAPQKKSTASRDAAGGRPYRRRLACLALRLAGAPPLRLGLRTRRGGAPADMGAGHDLDRGARHHQVGDDGGAFRVGRLEGLGIDLGVKGIPYGQFAG